jgi:hypothetical protein
VDVISNPTDEVIHGPRALFFNFANDERQNLSFSSISFSESKSAMCPEEEKVSSIVLADKDVLGVSASRQG